MTDYPFLDPPHMRSTDTLPVRTTKPELLDMERVGAHIQGATARGRYRGPTDALAYLLEKKCLIQVGDQIYATLAGILCFGRNPQDIFPRAVVDLGHWRGTEPVSSDVRHLRKDVGGTIFDQIKYIEDYLWDHTQHGMTLREGSFQRVEVHEYPQIVLRELCVNMLAHRDYANYMSASRVQMFRNRIEWISPGGLPDGVTVENLLVIQAARNPQVLEILYEAGYVEGFGQGLDTVVRTLREEGMSPPQFLDAGASFVVSVYGRPQEEFSVLPSQLDLNNRQEEIIRILRTQRERAPLAGNDDTLAFRDLLDKIDAAERTLHRDLEDLIKARIVEVIGAARARRYRLLVD